MKYRVGDTVKVVAGKDKGLTGDITHVMPQKNKVVVAGANKYTKHVRPMGGRAGEKLVSERPLPVAKIVLLNEKGEPDRIGYSVAKDGSKTRVFKKTGKPVPEPVVQKK